MRVALKFLVLAVAVSMAMGQSEAPNDIAKKNEANQLYNDGNALYKKGNFQGAIEKYTGAIAIIPEYQYYYQLGLCYKNLRQMDKAVAEFENSIKLKPDFAVGHYALGGAYLAMADYDKSIESFKSVLKADPNMDRAIRGITEAYAGKAQQLLQAGKIEDAGKTVDEAMAKEYDNSKLYLLAARIYNKLSQWEKALDMAQKALEVKKRGSKGAEYFELGVAYKNLKEYAKARKAFQESKKDPTYARNAQYELDGLRGR